MIFFIRAIVVQDVNLAATLPTVIDTIDIIQTVKLVGIATHAAIGVHHCPNPAHRHGTEMLRKTHRIGQKNEHSVNIRSSLETHLFGKPP